MVPRGCGGGRQGPPYSPGAIDNICNSISNRNDIVIVIVIVTVVVIVIMIGTLLLTIFTDGHNI